MLKPLSLLAITLLLSNGLSAQNINGFVIHVGLDAPAFIIFKNEVKSFEFNHTEGYRLYDIIRRSGNAISISYRRSNEEQPLQPQSAVVMEGKRTHLLNVVFQADYDINKNKQLLYDYSDLKVLKDLIAQHKQLASAETLAQANNETNTDDEIKRQQLAAKEQREKENQEQQAKIEAEKVRLANEAKERQRLAKAQAEKEKADQIANEKARAKAEQELQLAKKEQERLAKKAAEKERLALEAEEKKRLAKEAELANKEQARKLADKEKAKQEEERLAKEYAEKERLALEAEEKKRLAKAKEQEALRKIEEAENAALLAKQQQEKIEAEKKYSQVGIWKRYGSKGLNLYDIPPDQHKFTNADFFISNDTLRNFQVAQSIINSPRAPLYNKPSNEVNQIKMTLKNIIFEGGNVYYELLVENDSDDDFLQGTIGMYWYLQDGSPYKWLSCSYYTYINNLNIIRPGTSKTIVFVTRLADVLENDQLLLVLNDRRWTEQQLKINISGEEYNQELSKTALDEPIKSRRSKKK